MRSACRTAVATAGLAVLVLTGCARPGGTSTGGGSGDGPAGAVQTGGPEQPTAGGGPTASNPAPSTPMPSGPPLAADLQVTVDDGAGNRSAFTLRCQPPAGTHPDPAAGCAGLAAAGLPAFAPTDPGVACTEIYGGPETATVTGTVSGQRVDATFSRTDGCEISRWDALAPVLAGAGGPR